MTDLTLFEPPEPTVPALSDVGDNSNLASDQRAYLEYALSVVKGHALLDVCDGKKPVQRRILHAMSRMGLGFGGVNGTLDILPKYDDSTGDPAPVASPPAACPA